MDNLTAPMLEQSIVGCCFLIDEVLDDLDLAPDDFATPLYREMFAFALERKHRKQHLSLGLIEPFFHEGGRWASAGYRTFISIKENIAHPEEARTGAEVIRDMAQRRALISIASDLAQGAETLETAEEALDGHEIRLRELQTSRISSDFQPKAAPLATDDILRPYDDSDRLSTGWASIDEVIRGWARRKMTIMAARPGMGKSMFGIDAARRQAEAGRGTAIISMEMDHEEIWIRMAADLAYRSTQYSADPGSASPAYDDVKAGRASEAQMQMMREALEVVRSLSIVVDDRSALKVVEMHRFLRRLDRIYRDNGSSLDFVVVDYLQLARAGQNRNGNKVQEVTDISGDLRAMAKDLDVALVALSQLSRESEKRDPPRPRVSDLRESGALEQDAFTIGMLYRPAEYWRRKAKDGDLTDDELFRAQRDRDRFEIDFVKNRNGKTGLVEMTCNPGCNAIRDLSSLKRVA